MDTMTYPEYVATTFKKTGYHNTGEVQRTVDSMIRGLDTYIDSPRIYTIDDNGQPTLIRKTPKEWFDLTMELVIHKVSEIAKA